MRVTVCDMEGLVESRIMRDSRVSLYQRVIAEESSIKITYVLPLAILEDKKR